MKILAMETTESTASVAVTSDTKLLAEMTLNSGNTHSETLLPMIDVLMKNLRMTIADIDMIACAVGPGSFTGLRIGAATAKGLAMPKNTPCVGVSSIEAMAYSLASHKGIVCPAINARRGQFYTAIYKSSGDGSLETVKSEEIMLLDELKSYFADSDKAVYVTGSGYEPLKTEIPAVAYLGETERYESAYYVALCALNKYTSATEEERAGFTADRLNPVYLRKAQAEQELEERLKNQEK